MALLFPFFPFFPSTKWYYSGVLLTGAVFVLASELMVLVVIIFGVVGVSPMSLSHDTWTRHQT